MVQGRTPASLDLPLPTELSDPAVSANKQEVVYVFLRNAILGGVLEAEFQLPSTRTLAFRWRLSRGTIEAVYDRLSAEGYIRRRRGSGTFVSATIPDSYLVAQKLLPRLKKPKSRMTTVEAREYCGDNGVSVGKPFVARLPDPKLFPLQAWTRKISKMLATARTGVRQVSDPTGMPSLRRQISGYLREFRNLDCEPDDILITTGIRHAIDLVARSVMSVGEKACVEDPSYPFAHQILDLNGARVEYIPVRHDGIQVSSLRQHNNVRLVYVTPAHQSPLGITMSVSRRLELLEWASINNTIIIEDDYDSEFSYSGAPLPALMSLDRFGRVVYCGSFNKTLSPDIRIGFVVARSGVRDQLSSAWQYVGRFASSFEQIALEDHLRTGAFARHLRMARHTYVQRRDCLLNILQQEAQGTFSVSGVDAGFHFILWLTNGMTETELCTRALSDGIALQPLSSFCAYVELPPAVIVGYAALTMQQIEESGHKLAAILARSAR